MSDIQRHNGLEEDDLGAFVYYDEHRALLRKYANHAHDCQLWFQTGHMFRRLMDGPNVRCTCGLDALLSGEPAKSTPPS